MQSRSGDCSRSYSQIPGAQRSSEEWGTGRNWTLLDQIHGLHLALRVIEQCKGKIEPDRYKYHKRNAKPVFPGRSAEWCSISHTLQTLY